MSVYSGFATRSQQTQYDTLLHNILTLFSLRLLKFYNKEEADNQGFFRILRNQNKHLKRMERQRYMDPKYSNITSTFLGKIIGEERNSEISQGSYCYQEPIKPVGTASITRQSLNRYQPSERRQERVISLDRIVQRKQKKQRRSKKTKRCSTSVVQILGEEEKKLRTPLIGMFRVDEMGGDRVMRDKQKNMSEVLMRNPSKASLMRNEMLNLQSLREEKRAYGGSRFRNKMYYK